MGSYKLHITLRGCHIMGSPFDVLVHALEAWPPASEYYPVDADGIRSDVQLVLQDSPADIFYSFGGDTLADAAKSTKIFLGKVRSCRIKRRWRR